jgi:hypothetical protein
MLGDVFLLERDGSPPFRAERLAFGETAGRNEAWLRDTLFAHPDLLPVRDIDSSYGPLSPLCRELRTEAGPLDIAFINPAGRLTLVECKLWRNPEARRRVVAQVLDYARAVSRWSYSDLQRQVSAASGRRGNVPWELARERSPELSEQRFVDDATRAMHSGRFLLIIAGDGIREDVSGLADLINRNAASAFSFGLVEVALYGFPDASLAIQPRVVAKTQLIERTIVVRADLTTKSPTAPEEIIEADATSEEPPRNGLQESPTQAEYRAWWAPVINTPFDDPDQEPPTLYWPNNVRIPLPGPTKIWATAYRAGGDGGAVGVGTSGQEPGFREAMTSLQAQHPELLAELPEGTWFRPFDGGKRINLTTTRRAADFATDDEMRRWLSSTLNSYVNALRPRLKALMHAQRLEQR